VGKMTEEDSMNKPKRVVERSMKYPYYSLKYCVHFAEMIKNIGGRKEAPISSVLKEMKVVGTTNKRYSYSVSSAEQFGLIERTENGLKVTDIVMVILFPTEGEQQKKAALKDCFKKPTLYNLLINQYDGMNLPDKDVLKNQFLHHGIIENVVDSAVDSFIESAKYANVLQENRLIVTTSDETTSSTGFSDVQTPTPLLPVQTQSASPKLSENQGDDVSYHRFEFITSSGKKASVILPFDSTKKDIEKLKGLLDVFVSE
jgi:hypothetical protein